MENHKQAVSFAERAVLVLKELQGEMLLASGSWCSQAWPYWSFTIYSEGTTGVSLFTAKVTALELCLWALLKDVA